MPKKFPPTETFLPDDLTVRSLQRASNYCRGCPPATAAQAILGASFRVTRERGKVITGSIAPAVIATLHPSALLRMPDAAAREEAFGLLVADLKLAAKRAKT